MFHRGRFVNNNMLVDDSNAARTIINMLMDGSLTKPSNYSQYFEDGNKVLIYMSEVEPHNHQYDAVEDAPYWEVEFLAVDPDYRFVFHYENQRFAIKPELNKPYRFDHKDEHGFIHSDLVARFDDNRFWSEDWKEDRVLRCIFTIK